MDETELVKSLIVMLEELPYQNEEKADAIRRRAEMIIRKVFGDSSKYLKDLDNISFYLSVKRANGGLYKERWNSGRERMLNLFNTMLEDLGLSNNPMQLGAQEIGNEFSKRIFIVHGHDESMKQSVARTLEKIGLEPIILHERPNKGRTIIEKFTDHSDVSFAVVLLSPDDMAYSKDESHEKAKFRARQNVIFELGFFIGKLGREHVFSLYRSEEEFEIPSDYSGVIYVPFDEPGRWQFDLVRELQECGYDVDANALL
jgi:predicted nucleotide-binding protein